MRGGKKRACAYQLYSGSQLTIPHQTGHSAADSDPVENRSTSRRSLLWPSHSEGKAVLWSEGNTQMSCDRQTDNRKRR